ncbi:hypothetical protein T484DRAFT_1788592 [Baffinella frigidus]|nr:hypothetical protein T484DRAFT_1788592 [Cryptophyta sp. CCMP2293]
MPFASRIGVCFGVAGIALALPYVLLDVIPFPWNRRSVIMDLDGRSGQLPAWLKINLLRSFFGAIPKSLSIARFLRHKELRQDEGLGILGLGIEARNVEVDATLERELLELTGAPEGASSIFYWESVV